VKTRGSNPLFRAIDQGLSVSVWFEEGIPAAVVDRVRRLVEAVTR